MAVDVHAVRAAVAPRRHRQALSWLEAAHDPHGANRRTVQLGGGRTRPETKDDVVSFGGEQEDFVSRRIVKGDEWRLRERRGRGYGSDLQRGAREEPAAKLP